MFKGAKAEYDRRQVGTAKVKEGHKRKVCSPKGPRDLFILLYCDSSLVQGPPPRERRLHPYSSSLSSFGSSGRIVLPCPVPSAPLGRLRRRPRHRAASSHHLLPLVLPPPPPPPPHPSNLFLRPAVRNPPPLQNPNLDHGVPPPPPPRTASTTIALHHHCYAATAASFSSSSRI
jgi:hypothetical protein